MYVCVCVYTHIHTYVHTQCNITQPEKSEILPFATIWMDLEGIMLSEISQIEQDKLLYDITYMWNLKNKLKKIKK